MPKKIKLQIKHYITGSILFEYETEDNTLSKTVSEANLRGANLREANLRGADLYGANLYGANLYGADLYGADLYEADLREANLREANLRGANLYGADLREANLYGADLYEAHLRGADLREANLYGADLYEANLREADLREADLYGANLREADLYEADLREADLREADLRGADLRGAKNGELAIAMTRILPDEGAVIGWKKCQDDKIVKLLIPAEAKRSHAFGRKCRAEYAEVLEITKDTRKLKTAVSSYDVRFKYKVGETIRPTQDFNDDWTDECSTGIHFYITKLEAENH